MKNSTLPFITYARILKTIAYVYVVHQYSDHAWGNNLFVAGGSVDGGKILGEFPELASDKPLIFSPGIVVPTTPWESLWNSVAQWFGVDEGDLDTILPHRGTFDNLFQEDDLFVTA